MNQQSTDYYTNLDEKINECISKIKSHEFNEVESFDKNLLDESIEKWKEYREATAKMNSSGSIGGSLYSMIYTNSLSLITLRKLSEFEEDYAEVFDKT